MGIYSYVAAEVSGRKSRGTVEAANLDAAVATLVKTGVHLLDIQEARNGSRQTSTSRKRVSRADLEVTNAAVRDVHAGLPISEALAKFPDLFPSVFTMTLRAGEASGQFPQVASRLAELQQTDVRRRSQILGALIYPCVLLVTATGAVTFMEQD